MHVQFNIAYQTNNEQILALRYNTSILTDIQYVPFQKNDINIWQLTLLCDTDTVGEFLQYDLLLVNTTINTETILLQNIFYIDEFKNTNFVLLHHHNILEKKYLQVSNTKAFEQLVTKQHIFLSNKITTTSPTHTFKIAYPLLAQNLFLSLTGSANAMNHFDKEKPVFFNILNEEGSLSLNLKDEIFPIEYKLAIYDAVQKKVIAYEPGANKILLAPNSKDTHILLYENNNFTPFLWRGAGVNVPLFSIKTSNSWGCGDFSDLKLLILFAKVAKLKLIQLLPINDTTATYTDIDSYPYSAISSFALHPKFLNVAALAQQYQIKISAEHLLQINELNQINYSSHSLVIQLKLKVLKQIFAVPNNSFVKEAKWISFFETHKNWLQPYAIFCVLRDKFGTADFNEWGEYTFFNENIITSFIAENTADHKAVLFWYFVQYHLHNQLIEASVYAKENDIILKADLPIGVGRHSADTWVNPLLFHTDMQAGAPPDAFSKIGQNWSFPTYHITNMAKDDFAWFKKRMQHLQQYFDAVRIDHVLGIFRIWSIPIANVEGTLGVFVPALALQPHDIDHWQIPIDRLCLPFVNDELLNKYFGAETALVKQLFLDDVRFKPEYNTQKKLALYFSLHPRYEHLKQRLFELLTNVILIQNETGFHFRINVQETTSFSYLDATQQQQLNKGYHHYFYEMQNDLWQQAGIKKLQMLKDSTTMLLCAEDLGMVPAFTEAVLQQLHIIGLQVQQMPKNEHQLFANPAQAHYASVVIPATHDMAPLRLWWEQNRNIGQHFMHEVLHVNGTAPYFCEPWLCKKILNNHLQSPAIWSIFLIQDWLSIQHEYRVNDPENERINNPINPQHTWDYKMPITLEQLILDNDLMNQIAGMIVENNR